MNHIPSMIRASRSRQLRADAKKWIVAKRHTWQVAMQVAAEKALLYAAQLRSKGRSVTISLPSATTARDLRPTRQGETRPRTSHRHIASRNSLKLQQLGTQVRINVDTSATPPRLQQDAEDAARSGCLRTHVCVPGHADIAISLPTNIMRFLFHPIVVGFVFETERCCITTIIIVVGLRKIRSRTFFRHL